MPTELKTQVMNRLPHRSSALLAFAQVCRSTHNVALPKLFASYLIGRVANIHDTEKAPRKRKVEFEMVLRLIGMEPSDAPDQHQLTPLAQAIKASPGHAGNAIDARDKAAVLAAVLSNLEALRDGNKMTEWFKKIVVLADALPYEHSRAIVLPGMATGIVALPQNDRPAMFQTIFQEALGFDFSDAEPAFAALANRIKDLPTANRKSAFDQIHDEIGTWPDTIFPAAVLTQLAILIGSSEIPEPDKVAVFQVIRERTRQATGADAALVLAALAGRLKNLPFAARKLRALNDLFKQTLDLTDCDVAPILTQMAYSIAKLPKTSKTTTFLKILDQATVQQRGDGEQYDLLYALALALGEINPEYFSDCLGRIVEAGKHLQPDKKESLAARLNTVIKLLPEQNNPAAIQLVQSIYTN